MRRPDDRYRYDDRPAPRRGLGGPLLIGALVLWSGAVWLGALLVTALVGLVSANSGWVLGVMDSFASAVGLGKLLAAFNPAWWLETFVWLAQMLLWPAAFVVWILGLLGLMAAPRLLRALRDRGSRRGGRY